APAQVGERLVVHLHALAHVAGVVTRDGRPIAGAAILLRAEGDGRRRDYGSSIHTDAEGKFELSYRAAGRYAISAFAPGEGEGRAEGLELDGERDVEDVRIELDTPCGSIAGSVLLPAGHLPAEITLSASGAPGERTLRDDGSFTLPDLPPGPCRISVGQNLF